MWWGEERVEMKVGCVVCGERERAEMCTNS